MSVKTRNLAVEASYPGEVEWLDRNLSDNQVLDVDRLVTPEDEWRLASVDPLDPLTSYFGYRSAQLEMLASEKAALRLRSLERQIRLERVEAASRRLAGTVLRTPLHRSASLSRLANNQVFLKREDLQSVKSFKIRGAYNLMSQLSDKEKSHGVVTVSAGNHGQGVALGAKKLGTEATVIMPVTTPEVKSKAIENRGANTVVVGEDYDEANKYYLDNLDRFGGTNVPAFGHPSVIDGQGTVALEMLTQERDLDYIFASVGGGGLLAGSLEASNLSPNVHVVGVEPEGNNSMTQSLLAGRPVNIGQVDSYADGLAVRRPSDLTYQIISEYGPEMVNVDREATYDAMRRLSLATSSIIEPSGAVALAGALKYAKMNDLRGAKIAVVCSGGNTSPEKLALAGMVQY